jgi:predicted  nucleic acid-binding Zn-ribbon protein
MREHIVREDLETLVRLQVTEDRIAAAGSARDDLQVQLETTQKEIADLTRRRNEVQDKFDDAKRVWRDLESNNETKRAEVKKWEQRLDTIAEWREQQALSSATRDHRRQIERTESEINENLVIVEALEDEFNSAQAALEAAQTSAASLHKAHATKTVEVENSLGSEYAHRTDLLTKLPAADRRRFEQMAGNSKQVRVVCVANAGVCSFCNVKLPPQSWIEVQRQDKVINCQICRRMLVHAAVIAAGNEIEATA